MRFPATALLIVLASNSFSSAQAPKLDDTDRVRLAEAFRLADALGNKVWPGWDKAPFAVLLVTPEHEFLIRHPKPPDDFTPLGDDDLLKSKVFYRERKFSPQFLATFPVGGVPTTVIGRAEGTNAKTSTRWVVTLIHEHFHQLQYSDPRYVAGVDSLGLAGGDKTGMWMLNYPFSYDDAKVKEQFRATAAALVAAMRAREQPDFGEKLAAYGDARKKFRALLKEDDRKYLDFQTWQEGIARYTEYKVARLAASGYEPGKAFAALRDFKSYNDDAAWTLKLIESELTGMRLDTAKRTVFYPLGAAEGLVLDRAKPDWRKRYFEEKFSLDAHFRAAREH
jgi:hypothetical protein